MLLSILLPLCSPAALDQCKAADRACWAQMDAMTDPRRKADHFYRCAVKYGECTNRCARK